MRHKRAVVMIVVEGKTGWRMRQERLNEWAPLGKRAFPFWDWSDPKLD